MNGLFTWQFLPQSCTHFVLSGICVDLYLFILVRFEDLGHWGSSHSSRQLLKGFLALPIPLEDYVLLCGPGQWQCHRREPFDNFLKN